MCFFRDFYANTSCPATVDKKWKEMQLFCNIEYVDTWETYQKQTQQCLPVCNKKVSETA